MTNQKQELPMAAMFVNGLGQNEQSLKRTSYQVSVHLAKWFQRRMWKVNRRLMPSDDKRSHTWSMARWPTCIN